MAITETVTTGTSANENAARLEACLAGLGSAMVAYSGGVDSTVVLKAAALALGDRALGIMADTESTTDEDVALAVDVARVHGLPLETIRYSELAIENYAKNPANRCFFCKNELYSRLSALAAERGFAVVCDGSNVDDGGDYRPGLKAVAAHGVRSPLRELGLAKADVRALARHYGLPNHEKPSSPCLSSRIPYGQTITREKLDQVGKAEAHLRSLGLREFRVRHHGDTARIEANPEDFQTVLAHRGSIVAEFRRLGFHWVSMDLAGFRTGSLNRVLEPISGTAPDLSLEREKMEQVK